MVQSTAKSPEVKNIDNVYAIDCKQAVAVLAYTVLPNGEIDKIGVVTENNPHFSNGKYSGTVMGTLEKEDTSLLHRAKAELLEEAGISADDNEAWTYLGELVTSKLIPDPIYCFAVDVTGLPLGTPKGDGSEGEKGIKFSLEDINDALHYNDATLHFCFFKLFRETYKEQFN